MPKKDADMSPAEKDAGAEVPVPEQEHSGATSEPVAGDPSGEPKDADHGGDAAEPIADFDKHTRGVKRPDPTPEPDGPHGHPLDSTAEPVLVTDGSGAGQHRKVDRDAMAKISPEEAYDDPEYNPVAAADVPGHKGGPGAPGGTERQTPGEEVKEVIDAGHDEKPENLEYDWKGTNPGEDDSK